MAYTYLASGLIGLIWQRFRRKPAGGPQLAAGGGETATAGGHVSERRAE
jgi:hypothetical protein